jgi:transposase
MDFELETKAQLFSQCEAITPPPKYLAHKLADKFESGDSNVKIVMLPAAHPELNPIEHVWGIVKPTVASQNFTHSLKEVQILTKIQIRSFTGPHGSGPN